MNKGFSLVELIVVIAIMAILVGVAVPVYTGYIKEAEAAVDKQYVESMESALNTAWIDIQANLTTVSGAAIDTTKTPITVTVQGATITVKENGTATASATKLANLFDSMIDLDTTSTVEYVFTLTGNTFSYTPAA